MAFTLETVVPWGRSFDEYRRMFALTDSEIGQRILGCADGPASFNAELTAAGGTVILEVVFGLPGMGKMMIDAISLRDFPVVQGNVMLIATVMVVSNLLVDLSYGWFDPRIRYR